MGGIPATILVLSGLCVGFLMGFDQASSQVSQKRIDDFLIGNNGHARYSPTTTPLELLGFVRRTRSGLIDKLREDYGDYVSAMTDKGNLYSIFSLSESSKTRYRRRIMQKILQKQTQPKESIRFKWVSAGAEGTAGLGNDPDQSYTNIMEETVKDTFGSVGIEFVAESRAIPGFGSGPAASLCMEDLYGNDMDLLSWDFSASDADHHYRSSLWGIRASLLPSQPLLLMIDDAKIGRWKQMRRIDGKLGVALFSSDGVERFARRHLPDSARVTHPEQLPHALQHFHCAGAIEGHMICEERDAHGRCNHEKGDACREHKFKPNETCDVSKYQVDWVPGW